ncbi:hypothetical protein CP970_24720 [Streptomyces kanamyceticus]|uniref:Uncharacterized protein n=1 Tax=Streptomyces kanamyceticus TaxID=1967 RepID=A0A5J6GFH3_STRKN|nr:hypothetical protein CP970_24720 [Streptomyces kanamyceticus]
MGRLHGHSFSVSQRRADQGPSDGAQNRGRPTAQAEPCRRSNGDSTPMGSQSGCAGQGYEPGQGRYGCRLGRPHGHGDPLSVGRRRGAVGNNRVQTPERG